MLTTTLTRFFFRAASCPFPSRLSSFPRNFSSTPAAGTRSATRAPCAKPAGVSGAQWSPPLLQGTVQAEGREYRSGLKILTATNVENLCTCRLSREYGTICAHSLGGGTGDPCRAKIRPRRPRHPVTGLRGQGIAAKHPLQPASAGVALPRGRRRRGPLARDLRAGTFRRVE